MADLEKYLRKKQKLQKKKEEKLTLIIDEETFEFNRLSESKYDEIEELSVEYSNTKDLNILKKLTNDIVYHSCKDLHDPELISEIGVTYPPDIVKEIFSQAEINSIGMKLMTFNGMTEEEDIVKKA